MIKLKIEISEKSVTIGFSLCPNNLKFNLSMELARQMSLSPTRGFERTFTPLVQNIKFICDRFQFVITGETENNITAVSKLFLIISKPNKRN